MTPTARTLQALAKLGYTAGKVEYYNTFTNRYHDLFGFIDIVAAGNGHILFVQTTTQDNRPARERKIVEECWEAAAAVLASGAAIECWGWRHPVRGRRIWTVDRRRLTTVKQWLTVQT